MSILDLFDIKSDDEKTEYAAIPAGKYQVEIEEVKIDEANQYGPRLAYTLRVTDDSGFKNRKIWVNRKLASNTVWKIKQDLETLGCGDVSSANIESTVESLLGRTSNVEITYANNPKNSAKPYVNVNFVPGQDSNSVGEEIPF